MKFLMLMPWRYQNRADGKIPFFFHIAGIRGNCRVVLGYSSRSTLSLRAQGIGLPELRKELEEEKEVLFGFLRFRRRGIVLQYTHPDCSRVVKGAFSPFLDKGEFSNF